MRTLTAAELLIAWERGRPQPPVRQALTLLAAACPETPAEALAELCIGERDGRLLTLREWTFGSRLDALARCPACGQRLDVTFATDDIRATESPQREIELTAAGSEIRCRLPTSADLIAAAADGDVAGMPARLLQRCLLESRPVNELPPEVVTAVAERMAQADPQADVRLGLTCPYCASAWEAPFDVVSYFWTEIDAWARRVLRDVHTLASAYGWREADILAMSAWRRQCYLEMVQG